MKMIYEELTPMMKQYYEIKKEYMDYILFYRLGDFYEMFFDDAIKASKALEITLTARNCGMKEKAPLCGVPYHSSDSYLHKLIEKGFKVAICEQVEDPKLAKGLVKREVIRVVTPGTVIEPSMLDANKNNYILSLYFNDKKSYSISYADITTGEFRATVFSEGVSLQKICDEILKINPVEILIPEVELEQDIINAIGLIPNLSIEYIKKDDFNNSVCAMNIVKFFNIYSTESIGIDNNSILINSVGVLANYIMQTQKVNLEHFRGVDIYNYNNCMVLDKFTRKNLELVETIRGSEKKGSLLWLLDKTSTSLGARLLKKWIEEPLVNVDKIKKRQDGVAVLYSSSQIRDELKSYLKQIYDLERLSSKLVFSNVNCRDLIALKKSLAVLPYIQSLLQKIAKGVFADVVSSYDVLDDVFNLLEDSLLEEAPISVREGGMFKSSYNDELKELRDAELYGKDWILEIEKNQREQTGIKTLKIGFNKVFGYYIDVTKSNSHLVPETYIRKQTLANSERYIIPELKQIEEKILGAQDKIKILEYDLFLELKNEILKSIDRLIYMGRQIAIIDVITSFADVSYNYGYVKPEIFDDDVIEIVEGRHPVVEKLVNQEAFIPNNTLLDNRDNKMYIITGPNMAGKSTYLRQVALITLMSQIGCYVPATSARIGIVDRIFTRVGASDDLSQGQSTFMVEMNELANILHNATTRSLIILDEIGRGTSTYDGLSIAWSVVEYLANDNGVSAKTMFATHYHELTEIEGKIFGVKNYSILAKEKEDDIIFLRKIVKGRANQSFGIQVAKLAGVPDDVIKRAKQILIQLEEHDINNNIRNLGVNKSYTNDEDKKIKSIKSEIDTEIIESIKNIDLMKMTPMDAMNILYILKGKLGDKNVEN